jgi:hypothetical protein
MGRAAMNDPVLSFSDGASNADAAGMSNPSLHGALRAVLFGGLIAGSLDIAAACLINWAGPSTIMQAIAGGLLGPASFRMGAGSALLGLALQWFMSCLIAAIYVGAAYLQPRLLRHWASSGCAFGIPIYLVMNFVVVPLSAVAHRPTFTMITVAENLLAMILFGFVVAYCARRWTASSAGGRSS